MGKSFVVVALCLYGCGSVDEAAEKSAVLIVSPRELQIKEGTSQTIELLLDKEPNLPVLASLSSLSEQLKMSPQSVLFRAEDQSWAVPARVTVEVAIDKNAISEVASIDIHRSDGDETRPLSVSVVDDTLEKKYGWPVDANSFVGPTIGGSRVVAYQITIEGDTKLDAFNIFERMERRNVTYRMALYRDSGGVPGPLVAQMFNPIPLKGGLNKFDLETDVFVDTSDSAAGEKFWLALLTGGGVFTASTGNVFTRSCSVDVADVNASWPLVFAPSSCSDNSQVVGIWIDTYHQR